MQRSRPVGRGLGLCNECLSQVHVSRAKYAVPEIQKSGKGSIINISSVHGLLMAPKKLVYEAGKSSVIGVTRQMAIDFGPMGIRVNAICPGHIVTERIEEHWKQNPSLLRFFEAQYPVRRVGRPIDIANAINFLCSDEASFITGPRPAGGRWTDHSTSRGLRRESGTIFSRTSGYRCILVLTSASFA